MNSAVERQYPRAKKTVIFMTGEISAATMSAVVVKFIPVCGRTNVFGRIARRT